MAVAIPAPAVGLVPYPELGYDEQVMQHVQLVSPPMPCGVGWLVNCLLELNIRTTPYTGYWAAQAEGSQLMPAQLRQEVLWHLPALHRHRPFVFAEDLEVCWEHVLDFARYPARKTILFVRDLRDAAYSQFRRQEYQGQFQNTGAGLLRFLRSPFQSEAFPLLFDLPPADTLACFCLFWLHQIPAPQLLLVRFEDTRLDPLGQLQRVLRFLDIERPLSEISLAIEQSGFHQGLRINQALQDQTGLRRRGFRAGLTGEWQEQLLPEALWHFCGPAAAALEALGYAPLPDSVAPLPHHTSAEMACWQDLQPLIQACHPLLEQGQSGLAEAMFQQALQRCAGEPEMTRLLAGQYLALLWTRAILRIEQHHLPVAARMFRFFSELNARFSAWPPLAQAAARILEPDHGLHFLWPPNQLYLSPEPESGFVQAATRALASDLPYFLWLAPGVQIQNTGILQLCALLNIPHSPFAAAVPVIAGPGPDFQVKALQQHARWGAEFETLTLQTLPACLLLRRSHLQTLAGTAFASWLSGLYCLKALGVLAMAEGADVA